MAKSRNVNEVKEFGKPPTKPLPPDVSHASCLHASPTDHPSMVRCSVLGQVCPKNELRPCIHYKSR